MAILFGKKLNQCKDGVYMHWCPGCETAHVIHTESPNTYTGAKWQFDHNQDAPSFSPSVLVRYSYPKGYSDDNPAPVGWKGEEVQTVCHYFIRNGMIEYCGDSTHRLSGKTVELPDYRDY